MPTSSAKAALKRLLDFPTLWLFRQTVPNRILDFLKYQQRRVRLRVLEDALAEQGRYPNTVQRGPFKGLKYPAGRHHARFQKVIASYENEILPFIASVIKNGKCTDIVNVGGCDGYYAVGLAYAIPDVPVTVFETKSELHASIKSFAELNSVDQRLSLHGKCTTGSLSKISVGQAPFLLCDVEGAEVELLDPTRVGWLTNAIILLEIHALQGEHIPDSISQRFNQSHSIVAVGSMPRDFSSYPEVADLPSHAVHLLLDEERPSPQTWYFMEPKQLVSSPSGEIRQ